MSTDCKIAAFEGGRLRVLETGNSGREAALALPLNRLLVKMVRVPVDEEPVAYCEPVLKTQSPFPDDPLTVGCELVREDESGRIMVAAALPEGAADDIGEALDAAKLTVVRIDALVLGQLRGIWNALGESSGRRVLLLRSVDCISIVVLDGDQPSAIRAITETDDLRRELMLSLLEAEDFGGAKKLEGIVVVECDDAGASPRQDGDAGASPRQDGDAGASSRQDGDAGAASRPDDEAEDGNEASEAAATRKLAEIDFSALETFAPVRRLTVGSDAALVGVAERAEDAECLNALPESWREMLEETRFKRKLVRYVATACGFWLLVVGVMFGVPMGYDFATGYQKSQSKQHARQYAAVKEMKEKVELIGKYSDHARGALEIMKAVSDRLPAGITLTSWDYKREDGIRVSGESETSEDVYSFKDAMDAIALGEDEDAEKLFQVVELNGPNKSKSGYKFSIDCQYAKEGEE